GPVEYGFQLRELLHARIRAEVVVALHAPELDEEVVVEAFVVSGDRVAMARERERVLLLAGDAPLLGRDLHALAHRQPRARLDDGGQARLEVLRPEPEPRLDPFGGAP